MHFFFEIVKGHINTLGLNQRSIIEGVQLRGDSKFLFFIWGCDCDSVYEAFLQVIKEKAINRPSGAEFIIICVISSGDPPIKPVAIIKWNHWVCAKFVVFNASLDVTTSVQWNPADSVGCTYIKACSLQDNAHHHFSLFALFDLSISPSIQWHLEWHLDKLEQNLSRPSSFLIIFLLLQRCYLLHRPSLSPSSSEESDSDFPSSILPTRYAFGFHLDFMTTLALLVLPQRAPRHLRLLLQANLCRGHPNSRLWVQLPFRMSYLLYAL